MDIHSIREHLARDSICLDANEMWSLVSITGDDAERFLHNLTTNKVVPLETGTGLRQALLNKKSQVVCDFFLYRLKTGFFAVVQSTQLKTLLEQLENFHFAEDVEIKLVKTKGMQIHGRSSLQIVKDTFSIPEKKLLVPLMGLEEDGNLLLSLPITGEPGYLVFGPVAETIGRSTATVSSDTFIKALADLALEAGYPLFGVDFDNSTMVMELGLGCRLVDTTKGCFPGQEVVARIVSKGKVPRKLVPIEVLTGSANNGDVIELNKKKIGIVQRVYKSFSLKSSVLVAYLKTDIADSKAGYDFEINGEVVEGKLHRLPIYIGSVFAEERDRLYDRGMHAYHKNDFSEAENYFSRALLLDRHYADSWEAMAMAVEKRGDLDEAIRLNIRYSEADPMAVMAHTNLSRLYMLKGFKEKAEEEQGQAALIEFRLKAGENKQDAEASRKLEDKQQQQAKAELQRKMTIFKEVLAMDPEDEIANFGMGKLLLESGESDRAIHHLDTVLSNNPDYSMAWQLLGQAHIKAGDTSTAGKILRQGLEVAERQGDMMPAKAIKQMLDLI